MSISRAARAVLMLLVCGLAVLAAFVASAGGGSTATAAPTSKVVGTVSTRLTIDHFRAKGRRLIGQGTVVSKWRTVSGRVTTKRKHFRLQVRGSRAMAAEEQCNILFLEIGDLDLILAGLHVTLHAFNPDEPVRLQLSAIRENGLLGRLFCDLVNGGGMVRTVKQAQTIAKLLNKRLHRTTIMRVSAVIYGPGNGRSAASTGDLTQQGSLLQTEDECQVLHLILGPVHLDLLGLVLDLNKVVLDLSAIPGTLLGDIFCQLVGGPPPPPPPPAPPRG